MGGLNVAIHTSSRGLHLCDFNLCIQLYEATVRGHSVCALLGGHWTIVQKVCGGPSGNNEFPLPGMQGSGETPGCSGGSPHAPLRLHHMASNQICRLTAARGICGQWDPLARAAVRQASAGCDSRD